MVSQVLLATGELHHGQVPLGEAIAFWILAPIALAGAIGTVLLRNAVHSALSLVGTMGSLGMFYLIEQGPFIGFVQIIVYTGAIMILFLFVLMLVGRDASRLLGRDAPRPALGGGPGGHRVRPARRDLDRQGAEGHPRGQPRRDASTDARRRPTSSTVAGTTSTASRRLLFTKYLIAFELTSALLIVAAIGAMVLAHNERDEPKPTQKSLARARIRSGRPQSLPGPGVLSGHNAIGTAALLPDGSISTESVMAAHPGGLRAARASSPALPAGEGEDQ